MKDYYLVGDRIIKIDHIIEVEADYNDENKLEGIFIRKHRTVIEFWTIVENFKHDDTTLTEQMAIDFLKFIAGRCVNVNQDKLSEF